MDSEMTVFKQIAILFAEKKNFSSGVCHAIDGTNYLKIGNRELEKWFSETFQPTEKEIKEFNHSWCWWLGCADLTQEQDNEYRALVLLFADIIWREEVLGEDVYE